MADTYTIAALKRRAIARMTRGTQDERLTPEMDEMNARNLVHSILLDDLYTCSNKQFARLLVDYPGLLHIQPRNVLAGYPASFNLTTQDVLTQALAWEMAYDYPVWWPAPQRTEEVSA